MFGRLFCGLIHCGGLQAKSHRFESDILHKTISDCQFRIDDLSRKFEIANLKLESSLTY